MTVTIGAFSTNRLLAQPYGYDGTSVDGLTARKWEINGLLLPAEWQSLLTVYNTWRDTRITDVAPESSESVGTTVSLTANANGITATALACWFLAAPTGTQEGAYINAKVDLVDAAQQLAVRLRERNRALEKSGYQSLAITIGGFSATSLFAQPFGYEGQAVDGLTSRKWSVSGLLSSAQWQSLISVYDTWRTTRLTDADTWSSASVGTTVALTATANGISASSLACWFFSPPAGKQVGQFIDAQVELIDANQALAVLLRGKEKQRQQSEADRPSFGTYTLGSATLTLTKAPDTYRDGPQLALTAAGVHHITGPFLATRIKDLEGTTDATGWANVRSWYETTIASAPAAASWFPVSEPTATGERIIVSGAVTTRYTVRVTLAEVR